MNEYELSHLRYFVAVAEELHFGRAAARLHISQPPLTQQIQRLEERIGFALFERSTRHTALTSAGAAMLPIARAAIETAARAVEAARRAGRGESGELVLATPPSVMLTRLPKVIRDFRRTTPAVELRLREMSTAAIAEALSRGEVDLGFLRCPCAAGELARYTEGVVAVLPKKHRLVSNRKLRAEQLANEPFVFFPRRLGAGFFDELVDTIGFVPRVVQEATQWSTIVALVETGIGVTIGPASIARLAGRGSVVLPLAGVQTTLLLASGARPNAAARRFVETCSRVLSGSDAPASIAIRRATQRV
ncbi:MAG: LysR family transcriptional regulator [Acidobacteria bacterium]|nr:LysR family transcriptional regulator [Acidobacteriota bacterium]